MILLCHLVMVVVVFLILHVDIVHQVEGIDGLYRIIVHPLVQLLDKCLGGVVQYTARKLGVKLHLHLYDKLPSDTIPASYIHDAVLCQWRFRNKIRWQIFQINDLLSWFQRQQGVEQTHQ